MAGARCIEALRTRYAGGDIELVSLPHRAALERLARASLVLTSPGLTMTLESFQCGAPTYFLPPQNYSQWCTLRRLRAAGLAPHALHWEDLSPALRLGDRMPESERNPVVRAAIARFTADTEARVRLGRCLAEVGRSDHGRLACEQQRFFASLGPNGALTIASEIADHLRSMRGGREPAARARTPRAGRCCTGDPHRTGLATKRHQSSNAVEEETDMERVLVSLLRGICQMPAYVAKDKGSSPRRASTSRSRSSPRPGWCPSACAAAPSSSR